MAFKVKTKKFDLDLELVLSNGNTEVVTCKKAMNSKGYKAFVKHANSCLPKTDKEKEDVKTTPEDMVNRIIKQIDFLYEMGEEWWLENTEPQTLLAISEHIAEFHSFKHAKQ